MATITNQVIPSCAISIVLLAAAWLINDERLWSPVGNTTMPWICSSLAIAILVVAFTVVLTRTPAAEVPARVSFFVTFALTGGLAIGNVVDVRYSASSALSEALLESLSFGVILGATFWLPRLSARCTKEQSSAA